MAGYQEFQFCPPERLTELVKIVGDDDDRGLIQIELLLVDFPADPRIHFLRGSVLAGRQLYAEGREAMAKAVEIAPGYEIARFQLGFLELTSGDPGAATATWAPLHDLEPDHYLRRFVTGLEHLARDEFPEAISALRDGIARNPENPLMSTDMQRIIEEVEAKLGDQEAKEEPVSSAHLLLQQYAAKPTRH